MTKHIRSRYMGSGLRKVGYLGLAGILVLIVLTFFGPNPARHNNTKPIATTKSLSAEQFSTESARMNTLMRQRGIAAAFDYAASKISTDPSFAKDCHPLMHTLGD